MPGNDSESLDFGCTSAFIAFTAGKSDNQAVVGDTFLRKSHFHNLQV